MRVKCIDGSSLYPLTVGKEYEAIDEHGEFYLILCDDFKCNRIIKKRFKVIEESTPYIPTSQIIDFNGIQTEPFTLEQKKVIAVEKDVIKLGLFNSMLETFKTANELQRIALLEIFEEMGYPQTDVVKLYRHFQNEL